MAVIQFDVDGVLADFMTAFTRLAKAHGYTDRVLSCLAQETYETYPGMDNLAIAAVWRLVREDRGFWSGAPALVDGTTFMKIDDLQARHDVYFVTARVGVEAKRQTQLWLEWKGVRGPSVIMSGRKGQIAEGLAADYAIEDRLDNAVKTAFLAPYCKSYLLDRMYNRADFVDDHVYRVKTVDEFIDDVENDD